MDPRLRELYARLKMRLSYLQKTDPEDNFDNYQYHLNAFKEAMTAWFHVGGLPATWGTYYTLLGYDASGLTEEDKVTSVYITI